MWLWSVVLIPAAVSLLAGAGTWRRRSQAAVLAGLGLAGGLLAAVWIAGPEGSAGLPWLRAGDLVLSAGLRVDALSGTLGLAAVAAALVAVGGGRAPGDGTPVARVAAIVAAHLLVLLADSLWLVIVGWEAVGILCSRAADAGGSAGGRAALLSSRAGSLALLLTAALLLGETGTLDLDTLGAPSGPVGAPDPIGLAVAAMVLVAVAGRAGLVPLHGWMVRGAAIPGAVGVVHVAVAWTGAVYLLARLQPLLIRGVAVLALGAGLAVMTAVSMFLAAGLVPRPRMPGFLACGHAGLAVAALCCGGAVGAVAWVASLAPLLAALAVLSRSDSRAGHGAAILGALAAVLWIGLPGLGPAVLLRSRALAYLALPPVGGTGLAVGAALAVGLAAVAAVVWLAGGRGMGAPGRAAVGWSGAAILGLLAVGAAAAAGADVTGPLASALEPLVGGSRGLRGQRIWLLAPGMAALGGAMIAVAAGIVARGAVERVARSGTGHAVRLAAAHGWHIHGALRALALRPLLLTAVALESGTVELSGPRSPEPGWKPSALALPLLALAAVTLGVAARGAAPAPGVSVAAAAAILAVAALALLAPGPGWRTGGAVAVAGVASSCALLLSWAAAAAAWAVAVAALILLADRDRSAAILSLALGVALVAAALVGGPPAATELTVEPGPPGWRLVLLVAGTLLLSGVVPFQGVRDRSLAGLPPAAAILLAAAWPLAALLTLVRHGVAVDPGGWAAVAGWLPTVGAAIVVIAGPSALARGSRWSLAVHVNAAVVGWALVGVGTWTRLSVAGAVLLVASRALWLAAHLATLELRAGADRPVARPGPPGAVVAAASGFGGLLLILVDTAGASPQPALVALAGTLVLALAVHEGMLRRGASAGASSGLSLRAVLAMSLAVVPVLWPTALVEPAYRDIDRILVPPMPFRPADPEIVGPDDRVAEESQPNTWRTKNSTLAGRSASLRMNHGYQAGP